MIWVYAKRKSKGAKDLVETLVKHGVQAKRWRSVGKFFPHADDLVVPWGETPPLHKCKGAMILNAAQVHSKVRELERLRKAGVSCPMLSLTKPDKGEWLARSPHHTGGLDLLKGVKKGDEGYWSQRLHLEQEFRVHIFRNPDSKLVSIRAGMKVKREDVPPSKIHPWIRSWDGGWKLNYGQGNKQVPDGARDRAKRAIEALDLDFGAVDLGVLKSGQIVVLEVNKAPGIEGGTLEAYAQAIIRLKTGSEDVTKEAA